MVLHSFYRKKLIIRNLKIKNIHILEFFDSASLCCSLKQDNSINSLISCFSMFKIISWRSPSLLLSKTSFASLKIRKGVPIGVKLTFRKKRFEFFFLFFLYHILPNLTNFTLFMNLEKNKERSLNLRLLDVFVFPELRGFYFYFNKYQNLNLTLSINKTLGFNTPKFLFSLFELPNK